MLRKIIDLFPASLRPMGMTLKRMRFASRGRVMQGPFRGTHYIKESVGSAYFPKLMGTYERELSSLVEKLCRDPFETIVDVGAAEGFYAVGMARRCPNATVIAFESEPKGRELLAEMAHANGVADRITIRGHCEITDLRQAVLPGSLIIMDVEGAELHLLDPQAIPALQSCTILVELHDCHVPGVSAQLEARFAATHGIETIWEKERRVADLPPALRHPFWLRPWMLKITWEARPQRMSWFFMTPLST